MGAYLNDDRDMTAATISIRPRDIAYYRKLIRDRYMEIRSLYSNSESSTSGWSPFSRGDDMLLFGLIPNIVKYPSIIFSIYFLGEKHTPYLSHL